MALTPLSFETVEQDEADEVLGVPDNYPISRLLSGGQARRLYGWESPIHVLGDAHSRHARGARVKRGTSVHFKAYTHTLL